MKNEKNHGCLIFVLLALFLTFFSCSKERNSKPGQSFLSDSTSPARNVSDTFSIHPTGIQKTSQSSSSVLAIVDGWLHIDISEDSVLRRLGEPDIKGANSYLGATGTYAQSWEYSGKGLSLDMESDKVDSKKVVEGIMLSKECKLSTDRGISLGDSEEKAREAYKSNLDTSASIFGKQLVVGTIYEGTVFTIADGKVAKIFVGHGAY
jgi:hypothetical protein